MSHKKLHVLSVISNPVRYRTRSALYHQFVRHISASPIVTHWTAEAAFGNRDFEVTEADNPHHLQLRTRTEIWHKENLVNCLIDQLPDDDAPVAWIDADVLFTRPNWAEETIEQLEHYDVVQMFDECQDLDNRFCSVPGSRMRGMISAWLAGLPREHNPATGYSRTAGHCGYAWAISRSALKRIGGRLLDTSVVGSADYQMAAAFMGRVDESIPGGVHPNYANRIRDFGKHCQVLQKNIGYVPGLLLHNWHGKKSNRGYEWRNKILTEHKFNPSTDIKYDASGLLELNLDGSDRMIAMRNSLREYFRSRNEDE